MRALFTGDDHFEEGARFSECVRVHEHLVELARDVKPDVLLDGGDIYEKASSPVERQAVAEWLSRMAEICPVIITKGNHDRPLDCSILGRLRTKHPVTVEERSAVHLVAGAAIACVAWPSRASIAAMLGAPLPAEQIDNAAREAMRGVFRALGAELNDHDGPRIALGHFMIDGSVVGRGQPPLVGAELNIHLTELALFGADAVLASHIHQAQDWRIAKTPVIYAGTSYRRTWGEPEQKSVVLLEFKGRKLTWKRIPTPATEMVLLTAAWANGVFEPDGADRASAESAGAEVRFRYRCASDQREAAASAAAAVKAELLDLGAALVKVEEEVIVETRARAPEIAAAATLPRKLEAFWKANGYDPGERRGSLLAKLDTVETTDAP